MDPVGAERTRVLLTTSYPPRGFPGPASCRWARHRAWSLVAAAPPPGRDLTAPAAERERVTA
ncbi:hypothetical protein [Streptomyces hirsutus]|uniref:hypothetical protein n=1 Tax=Streptomyces hirsutus TaxID=35620 RepID=UPI00362E03BA